ncbi:hypothetical protein DFJ58DRAFT_739810 [Suillus subalutaceus]|uniref:uncharacterized protein n=1 Tax=Suillus subalutaceus TaxID=48586 RepID=UPI001B8659A3|nr:uncharacterized protein DFJ58DRAFT_739810 [Suillus subalutaceus]KAG1815905.1 hypothetical protein DFJ58DRAFT_739810 [Suillus subalutaceus]
MAHWHGLTKLQMHSDWTLDIMDQVTSAVGQQFRNFKAMVCWAYITRELHQEVEAHARRNAKQAAKKREDRKGGSTVQVIPAGLTDIKGDVQEYDSESEEGDDGTSRVGVMEDIGEWFGASNESLLEQFDEMYDSDVDLDYEN